jgi:TM2 domain-containing membrane protein YozV
MFCPNCGRELSNEAVTCPNCGHPMAPVSSQSGPASSTVQNVSPKSRLAVVLLSFFLGWLGIHRFYVGKVGTGILWLFTAGLLGIGNLVDFIMALVGSFTDKSGAFVLKW